MPSKIKTEDGEQFRYFTCDELHDLGMTWDKKRVEDEDLCYPENWNIDYQHTTDSHGCAYDFTFPHDGYFWKITIGYYHEDWQGTNDFVQCDKVLATKVINPEAKKYGIYYKYLIMAIIDLSKNKSKEREAAQLAVSGISFGPDPKHVSNSKLFIDACDLFQQFLTTNGSSSINSGLIDTKTPYFIPAIKLLKVWLKKNRDLL